MTIRVSSLVTAHEIINTKGNDDGCNHSCHMVAIGVSGHSIQDDDPDTGHCKDSVSDDG